MAETKQAADGVAGKVKAGVGSVRASATSMNRIMVLGFAAVITSSMLRWAITLNVLIPLLANRPVGIQPGIGTDLLLACYQQISLLIVLPLLAWGAGWLFDGRGLRLMIGAALFHEVWMGFVSYLSDGSGAFTARPVLVITKVVLAIGIAFLAAKAFRHAQGRLEAMSEAQRRKAPDTDSVPVPDQPIGPPSEEAIAAAREIANEVVADDEVVEDAVAPATNAPSPAKDEDETS